MLDKCLHWPKREPEVIPHSTSLISWHELVQKKSLILQTTSPTCAQKKFNFTNNFANLISQRIMFSFIT